MDATDIDVATAVGSDRPFGGVVVDLDTAVVDISHQHRPVRQRVLDRRSEWRFRRGVMSCPLRASVDTISVPI
jgi:hypothetical protein